MIYQHPLAYLLGVEGLALVHVPTLTPVLAEFARVLRPGGHLVASDVHQDKPTGQLGRRQRRATSVH